MFIIIFLAFIFLGLKTVQQQTTKIVERFGKYNKTLTPGLNFIVPFLDKIKKDINGVDLVISTTEQVKMIKDEDHCITMDNVQLLVEGVIYYQVTSTKLAVYGSSDYHSAITQLAMTTVRAKIGSMDLDKILHAREEINQSVVTIIDEAAISWGVKVLRFEIKNIDVVSAETNVSMQQQSIAEREKRATILISEGDKESVINRAKAEAEAIIIVATAKAQAIDLLSASIAKPGGIEAANISLAKDYMDSFAEFGKSANTVIVPSNMSDVSSLITIASSILKATTVKNTL